MDRTAKAEQTPMWTLEGNTEEVKALGKRAGANRRNMAL